MEIVKRDLIRMKDRFFTDEELHAIHNRGAEVNPVYEALPFFERYIDYDITRFTYDGFIEWCSPNEDRIRIKAVLGSFGLEAIVTYGTLREHLLHANKTLQSWGDQGQRYNRVEDIYAYSIEDATYTVARVEDRKFTRSRIEDRFLSDEQLHAIHNWRDYGAVERPTTYDEFIKHFCPNEDRIRVKLINGSNGLESIVTYGTLRDHLSNVSRSSEDRCLYSIEDATYYDYEPDTAEHDLKAQEAEESILSEIKTPEGKTPMEKESPISIEPPSGQSLAEQFEKFFTAEAPKREGKIT